MLDTIKPMATQKTDPLLEKLSVISAIILLTYAVTSFVNLPSAEIKWNVFGAVYNFTFDLKTYITILVPAFAGVGAYWLVKTHPAYSEDRYPLQHSILPALTAWVIGLPLTQMSNDSTRWIVFLLGGAMLIVTLTAEYVVVDIKSEQHVLASGLLKALSLAMFFFVLFSVRVNILRLYMLLPAVGLTAFFILLRVFYLQTGGKWLVNWAAVITILIAQMALGLHYLPVRPVSYGLILLGPYYALIDFATAYPFKRGRENLWLGLAMMLVFLLLAFIL